MVTLLEYEWLTGTTIIEKNDLDQTLLLMQWAGIDWDKNEFAFWMKKSDRHLVSSKENKQPGYLSSEARASKAAAFWEKGECPYERALVMFEGKDDDKKNAIEVIQDLGADAVYQKMKQEMRKLGIKNIPRGIRSSTRSNAALLTGREIDVLQLLKGEMHNKEIAAQLYISPKTVDHHVSNILFKLEADSRSKAVINAVKMGILK
jgi:DNA-binding CsgD family transcriptional regulator